MYNNNSIVWIQMNKIINKWLKIIIWKLWFFDDLLLKNVIFMLFLVFLESFFDVYKSF